MCLKTYIIGIKGTSVIQTYDECILSYMRIRIEYFLSDFTDCDFTPKMYNRMVHDDIDTV